MTRRAAALAALCPLLALPPVALAQPDPKSSDTAFTYQGRLTESGAPANGAYDLAFTLWTDPVAGSQIGNPVVVEDLSVEHGLFSVQLDFGASAFDNSGRWLEITVNDDTLSPRTPITRSPYAVQTRGIFVDQNQRVGIGTTTPEHDLDIESDVATARLTTNDPGPLSVSRLLFKRSVNAQSIYTGLGAIDFANLDDVVEASISAGRLGAGSSTRLDISVGVGNPTPQITIFPETGVQFGPNAVKPPLAYAKVVANATVASTPNITSITHSAPGLYRVHIDGGFQDTDITLVTVGFSGVATARVVIGGDLLVETYTFVNPHVQGDRDFSLVIYRP
ncbi:MAG: hypothetical protein R3B57_01545 [Phycisphaerales bacterium]